MKRFQDREIKKQLWITYSREDIEEEIEDRKKRVGKKETNKDDDLGMMNNRDLLCDLKYDVNLTLRNVVDMEFVALNIKERIPPGYSIKDIKKINPQPSSIGEENGATVIYWNIDRFRNYTTIYFIYSLSGPKVSGNNNFSAEVIGFDIAGNRYIAKNEMSQTVRKKSLWQIILEFFGM